MGGPFLGFFAQACLSLQRSGSKSMFRGRKVGLCWRGPKLQGFYFSFVGLEVLVGFTPKQGIIGINSIVKLYKPQSPILA